jgi:isocitrate dehydrogenase (NAD+)
MAKVHHVTVLPGDGIGPEVIAATRLVVDATGVVIVWYEAPIGLVALSATGSLLPDSTISSIAENRVALKGPTGTPIGGGHRSLNVTLREHFDLYANVRPVRSMPGVVTPFPNVDLVIFRENSEDLYIGEEHFVDTEGKIAEAISRISWRGSARIARFAFEYAKKHGRIKMAVGHKGNILQKTHGHVWLGAIREVAREYTPEIFVEELIADNLGMQLVMRLSRDPRRFDCVLLTNFLGDIFSDVCAGLVGGLGFAPGANIGEDCAIFEAVHGTAPDIAGQGIANPTALILSAAMMLDHLGEPNAALRVRRAVDEVFAVGEFVTRDVDENYGVSTNRFALEVAARL